MNSRINTKLLLTLFAVLALNHAVLNKARSGSADFASKAGSSNSTTTLSDELLAAVKSGQTNGSDLSQSLSKTQKAKITKLNVAEGTFELQIDCDSCGISSDPVPASIDMKDLNNIGAVIAKAEKQAKKDFDQKNQAANDIKNCNVQDDDDSTPIQDSDVATKLACFQKQEGKLSSADKQTYMKNVVDPYLKKNITPQLDQELSSGNSMAQGQAKSQIEQLMKMNVGSSNMTSQLNMMDQVATTNLLPSLYQQQLQVLTMQNSAAQFQQQQAVTSAQNAVATAQANVNALQRAKVKNPAQIQQANAQLNSAKQALAADQTAQQNASAYLQQQTSALNQQYFGYYMNGRQSINAGMATLGGALGATPDPTLMYAAQMSVNNIGQATQSLVKSDPNLNAAYGSSLSFLAPQNTFGMGSMMGFGSTSFMNDPFNSGIDSTMSQLNSGINPNVWSSLPANGSNISSYNSSLAPPPYLSMPLQTQPIPGTNQAASFSPSFSSTF
jgi:hypothetical protein